MQDVLIRGAAMTRFGRFPQRRCRDLGETAEVFGADAGGSHSFYVDIYAAFADGSGRDRFDRHTLAQVAVKNHHHGSLNPWAQYQEAVTEEQVLAARQVAGPLTVMM